ncbi:PAS domain S-box-containing protein [Marivirga sericea]|uniref:histidine kinase n=1 Tax=Marivirga sericea TaxID=1028 RepID=A0A1X7IFG7_9BACT|nr:PAS domain S-box protein [Marivirga sericea]SMG12974.1 PAS domain S-box-containing protein [Marivirga sericea]
MNYRPNKNFKIRSLAFATAIGLISAILFSILIIVSYQYYQKQKYQQLQSELNMITENIRKIMINSNLAAFSVGLTISPITDTVSNFDFVAKEIMERHPYLYGVQILKKGVIQYVYPSSIHSSVIGYDILKDSSTRNEAQKAIHKKEIYYAGPLEFKQGGKGIIGRLPIFHRNEFWGFSAVLMTMDDFLSYSGIKNSQLPFVSFQLSKVDPNTGEEEIFTSSQKKSELSLDYTFSEAGWKVTAFYEQDAVVYILLGLVIFLAFSSSIGSGFYVFHVYQEPERLQALLSKKTKEIAENNRYLASMVKAIPDLIFVYDKDAKYLDFHAYQRSLLYYLPQHFIGKSSYDLFPKDFATKIHENIKAALTSNRVEEHSYYLDFKRERKYFEARYIAINSEEVLAVVRDVTESKLAAEKLEKSEQKYRELVSQASDAILLADENGNLLELNHKGSEMTGIPNEEITKYNLSQIIKFEKKDGFTLTELIHRSGSIFEEACLIPLNGIEAAVEISCKLTPSKQIQGIVRDITAKHNFIKSIRNQNNQLREIAWVQSHEVRAPLARLLGLIDFIEKYQNGSQEEQRKVTHSIRSSALELDIIIRDVVRRTEEAEDSIS